LIACCDTALILVPGTGTRQNEEEVESTGSCKENSWDESRSLFERTALSLIPKTAPNFTAPSDDVVTQRFHRVSRGEGPCCVPLFSCGHPGDAKVESPLQLLTPGWFVLPIGANVTPPTGLNPWFLIDYKRSSVAGSLLVQCRGARPTRRTRSYR
jgi:hypothetical protein